MPTLKRASPFLFPLQPEGEKLIAYIYAFVPTGSLRDEEEGSQNGRGRRLGGARSYRKNEGVMFLRNGQTHGSFSKDFFRRNNVKMKPLADDLLVFVECDNMGDFVREDLFMPSRDRLADNAFKTSLLEALEDTVRECPQLKELRNKRQQERLQARIEEERPLADVLKSLIQGSPNLTTLLQMGQRIPAPFNTQATSVDETIEFKGEHYPTFFKYKGVEYGSTVDLSRSINHRIRLTFETNVENKYFTRNSGERGSFDLVWTDYWGDTKNASITGPNLKNGIATIMMDFPEEAKVGKKINYFASVKDPTQLFEIPIHITPTTEVHNKGGGSGNENNPPGKRRGNGREKPIDMALPKIRRIYREDWDSVEFDEFTSMRVESLGPSGDDENTEIYEFMVNMDNTPLKNESKQKRLTDEQYKILCEQFLYGNVLIGLSLLLEDKKTNKNESPDSDVPTENIEERIESVCRAMAPFIPALISLGSTELEMDNHFEGLEEVG